MINIKIMKKLEHFTVEFEAAFDLGVLVIQGESGAGKTTVLDCIAGLRRPDDGEIAMGGRVCFSQAKGIDVPVKDRNIGYVFQNYALFPHMTVVQNIMYGQKCKGAADQGYIDKLLDSFNIRHLKDKHPAEISGGEKQRAALARALAVKQELLLLDEPFSALDNKTKEAVYEEFNKIKQSFAFKAVLVTHNEREARLLGDSVIAIKDGKIVE